MQIQPRRFKLSRMGTLISLYWYWLVITQKLTNVIGSYRFYSSQINQNGIDNSSINPLVIVFEPLSFLCKHNKLFPPFCQKWHLRQIKCKAKLVSVLLLGSVQKLTADISGRLFIYVCDIILSKYIITICIYVHSKVILISCSTYSFFCFSSFLHIKLFSFFSFPWLVWA